VPVRISHPARDLQATGLGGSHHALRELIEDIEQHSVSDFAEQLL
jgi:hypothetical protein